MAVKWELVKAGDLLWDSHREKMGNTTLSRMGSWPVRVVSIDHVKNTAQCAWNYNPAATWSRRRVEKLRRRPAKRRNGECTSCGATFCHCAERK